MNAPGFCPMSATQLFQVSLPALGAVCCDRRQSALPFRERTSFSAIAELVCNQASSPTAIIPTVVLRCLLLRGCTKGSAALHLPVGTATAPPEKCRRSKYSAAAALGTDTGIPTQRFEGHVRCAGSTGRRRCCSCATTMVAVVAYRCGGGRMGRFAQSADGFAARAYRVAVCRHHVCSAAVAAAPGRYKDSQRPKEAVL
jgi:hypothetical protein